MEKPKWIPVVFYLCAIYDLILGVAFLAFAPKVFEMFNVTPPNHPGYVQFPGLLLIVFAAMYSAIARNPRGNRNLILYGIMMKVSYSVVVFGHWLFGGIPAMWKPFAIVDILFVILFLWAATVLKREAAAA